MSKVALTIDNRPVEVEAGLTILEAARTAGIKIPTLCTWPEIHHTPGACRVCMTEVEGQRSLIAACVFPVSEGMVVHANTEKVRQARKMVVELLLADHPQECNFGVRNGNCELQKVAEFVGLKEVRFEQTQFPKEGMIDRSSPSVVRDNCVACGQCILDCPVGALYEKDDVDEVWKALQDSDNLTCIQ
jgi:NADH-quinone oxidoreductase subunit G